MTNTLGKIGQLTILMKMLEREDYQIVPAADCKCIGTILEPVLELALYNHEQFGKVIRTVIIDELLEQTTEHDLGELVRCIRHSCLGMFAEKRVTLFGLRWKFSPGNGVLQLLRRRNTERPGFVKLSMRAKPQANGLRDYERIFRERLMDSPAMFISSQIDEVGLSIDYNGFENGQTVRRQYVLDADIANRLTDAALLANMDFHLANEMKAYQEFVAARRTDTNLRSQRATIRRIVDKVVHQSRLDFFELVDLDFDPLVTVTYRVKDFSDKKRTFRFVGSRATLRRDFAEQLAHHVSAREAYDRHAVDPKTLAA